MLNMKPSSKRSSKRSSNAVCSIFRPMPAVNNFVGAHVLEIEILPSSRRFFIWLDGKRVQNGGRRDDRCTCPAPLFHLEQYWHR